MNEPVQISPLLSVFSDDGEFTLRVDGSDLAKILAPQITKAIGQVASARKLTLLTPTDTKIFKFNGADGGRNQTPSRPSSDTTSEDRPLQDAVPVNVANRPHIVQDYSAPPSPEVAEQAVDEYDAELASQQQAEREMRQAERTAKADAGFSSNEGVDEAPAATRKRTPRERPTPLSATSCGRCGGQGRIDGGGTCPVCRGQKSIPHYGRRTR